MRKFVLAVLAMVGVAAAVPANAQGVWFGAPGLGVGVGVGPGYGAGPGYAPYYAAGWGGPTWGQTWGSYGYRPFRGYRSYGYPASYGYSGDWYGSDVALETYGEPTTQTYAVASENYTYPRRFRYRTDRSYAYAPSRAGYSRMTDGYRSASFSRTAVRHRSLQATARMGVHRQSTTDVFGDRQRSLRSAPVAMGRGSAGHVRSGPASQVRNNQMNGRMR